MTVKELIEKLKELPEDKRVMVVDWRADNSDIDKVDMGRVTKNIVLIHINTQG